jgi:hypothetical protein
MANRAAAKWPKNHHEDTKNTKTAVHSIGFVPFLSSWFIARYESRDPLVGGTSG